VKQTPFTEDRGPNRKGKRHNQTKKGGNKRHRVGKETTFIVGGDAKGEVNLKGNRGIGTGRPDTAPERKENILRNRYQAHLGLGGVGSTNEDPKKKFAVGVSARETGGGGKKKKRVARAISWGLTKLQKKVKGAPDEIVRGRRKLSNTIWKHSPRYAGGGGGGGGARAPLKKARGSPRRSLKTEVTTQIKAIHKGGRDKGGRPSYQQGGPRLQSVADGFGGG